MINIRPIIGGLFVVLAAFFCFKEPLLLITQSVPLLFACLVLHRAINVFNFRRITIPAFFLFTYTAMIFVPSIFVANNHPGPYRNSYLIAVSSVFATVPLGILLSNRIFRFNKAEIDHYYSLPIKDWTHSTPFILAYLLPVTITIGLTMLYMTEVPVTPLTFLISNPDDIGKVMQLREESLATLDSQFRYFYYLSKTVFYPFLIASAFGFYLSTKKKTFFLLFIGLLASGVCYAGVTTSKGQVALIALVTSIFYYLFNNGNVKKRFILLSLSLILLFPTFIFYLLYKKGVVEILIQYITGRLFYSPAEMIYYYFEVFPDKIDYLYGTNIGMLAKLLDLDFFDATRYISGYLGNEYGSANASFVGDANANFGIAGVLFEGILAGSIMQTFQIILLRQEKTVLSLALYALLIVVFWQLNSGSLQLTLMSDGAIPSLILYFVIIAVTRFLRTIGKPPLRIKV